jgi:hypothetical protein
MKWLLVAVAALGACKRKEIPFEPPSPEDAGAVRADAAVEIDAAITRENVRASKIVVGDHASCALLTDATVRCWGRNTDGQLGDGTTNDAATPVKPNLRGVSDIVFGGAHACALLDDGSVTCWGKINYGAKGPLLAPAAAPGVARAKRIFAVGAASCATLADSSLVCWGDIDAKGHWKLSASAATRPPTPARGLDRVAALTANGALRDDGTVWFRDRDGALVRTALDSVIEVASSGEEVCGLRRDGKVACVGPAIRCVAAAAAPKVKAPAKPAPIKKTAKTKPGAKPGAKTNRPDGATTAPAQALPIEVLRLPPAQHLAFDVGLCVVTKPGRLQCLASQDGCRVDAPWPGLANVDYAIGNCARLANGEARCWSADAKSRMVREIAGVSAAIAVAASSSHACAILGDRSVACWGSNKFGALGRGAIADDVDREASAVTF